MDMITLAGALADKGLLPGAKPTEVPGLAPVVSELFGYGLYFLVLAGAGSTGFGVYKLATADKSRNGGGSEPFKWMGGGVLAIMLAGTLITILNGIAA
ncbi:hypothetical protein GCM10020367_69070 [Streptomyces sannanensis]|uniref:Integral membrane protein n=1 Tax=Streptomyces sannanensis TaxID=285536 RepID=A0ABP6SN88_9ACTN